MSSSSSTSQPFWPSLCASLVLGNTKEVLSDAVSSLITQAHQTALSTCMHSFRLLDSVLSTQLHAPAIVYFHAKGTSVCQPDAFLEQFNELPAELMDIIFQQLPSQQNAQLQLVCRRWRDIARLRRRRVEKRLVPFLTIRFDEKIVEIINDCGRDSLGIFSGSGSHKFPLELSSGLDRIRVRSLDVHLRRLSEAVSSLCLDQLQVDTVNLFVYDTTAESWQFLEQLLEDLKINPSLKQCNAKLFMHEKEDKAPEWLFDFSSESFDIQI
ncbi:hypothetical protein WR25_00931 [Diploscapter pachys]|uniref:F-box domain-containing protein n=1 Tax=Diploscapter pachys TaxID=2018661 RepID=A0A2A2KVR9_9BILA|nr:hypothetical protein WR25_00931 [Diploscapter pachys]